MNKYFKAVKTQLPVDIKKERDWIKKQIKKIGASKLQKLIDKAKGIRKYGYAPYSNYIVGAAVLGKSQKIYAAANTEVVSYPLTSCGEKNAITKAISEGEAVRGRKFIEAMAICHPIESQPCGSCRQIIAEHCDNTIICDTDLKGNLRSITSLKSLLFLDFSPTNLGKK